MNIRITIAVMLSLPCVAYGSHLPIEPQVPFVATFDQFAGRELSDEPEPGSLDGKVWSFSPNIAQGFLPFSDFDAPPPDIIATLPAGFYAIREPRGAALALRPGIHGIEVQLNLHVPWDSPTHLFVMFHASVLPVPPRDAQIATSKKKELIRVEFSWSKNDTSYVQVPSGTLTFDVTSGIVQASPVLRLSLDSTNMIVHLKWTVPYRRSALVILDDIVVQFEREDALLFVHVDSPLEEQHFLRDTLRKALASRRMKIVTCVDDITEEKSTIDVLGQRNIGSSRDPVGSRPG